MGTKTHEGIVVALETLNKQLRKEGMLQIALVSPKELVAQKVNARYMDQDMLTQLTENIKSCGMESLPLCHLGKGGKFELISGHHRKDAALRASVEKMMVLYTDDLSRDELVSKQLAHNALSGKDDPVLLKTLFESIEDIELRIRTGLSDEDISVDFTSINFRVGAWEELVLLFLPEGITAYDDYIEEIDKYSNLKSSSKVRVADSKDYEDFAEALRKIKRVENIKSNATAIQFMAKIASIYAKNKMAKMSQEKKKGAKKK